MALNKVARQRNEKLDEAARADRDRLANKESLRVRNNIVADALAAFEIDNRKIMALHLLGFNDTQIGQAVKKTQGSIFGYRRSNVQPSADVNSALDDMITRAIRVVRKAEHSSQAVSKLWEGIIAYAEEALD